MSKKGTEILHKLLHYTDNAEYWETLVEYTQYLPTKYQKQLIEQILNGNSLHVAFEQEREEFNPLIERAKNYIK